MQKEYEDTVEDPNSSQDNLKVGKEQDIGEMDDNDKEEEDDDNVTLEDITIDNLSSIRGIISDVLLDILLYYQPSYRERIINTVSKDCNRIYNLYKQHNPDFKGNVSIVGHS